MKIQLLAIGNKMPNWVGDGYQEYAKRMQGECSLQLKEIPACKRGKNADIKRICADESQRLLSAVSTDNHVVMLDVATNPWSTEKLAEHLESWMHQGQNVSLLVGGPDGLDSRCRQRANQIWSLSPLTFPHPLVRIIIAEQLYRAHSIIRNHPYHRAG